jgi:hypothetical protein
MVSLSAVTESPQTASRLIVPLPEARLGRGEEQAAAYPLKLYPLNGTDSRRIATVLQ